MSAKFVGGCAKKHLGVANPIRIDCTRFLGMWNDAINLEFARLAKLRQRNRLDGNIDQQFRHAFYSLSIFPGTLLNSPLPGLNG